MENVPEIPIVTLVLKIHMVACSTCIQCFPWDQVPNTIGTYHISSLSTSTAIPYFLDNVLLIFFTRLDMYVKSLIVFSFCRLFLLSSSLLTCPFHKFITFFYFISNLPIT